MLEINGHIAREAGCIFRDTPNGVVLADGVNGIIPPECAESIWCTYDAPHAGNMMFTTHNGWTFNTGEDRTIRPGAVPSLNSPTNVGNPPHRSMLQEQSLEKHEIRNADTFAVDALFSKVPPAETRWVLLPETPGRPGTSDLGGAGAVNDIYPLPGITDSADASESGANAGGNRSMSDEKVAKEDVETSVKDQSMMDANDVKEEEEISEDGLVPEPAIGIPELPSANSMAKSIPYFKTPPKNAMTQYRQKRATRAG